MTRSAWDIYLVTVQSYDEFGEFILFDLVVLLEGLSFLAVLLVHYRSFKANEPKQEDQVRDRVEMLKQFRES